MAVICVFRGSCSSFHLPRQYNVHETNITSVKAAWLLRAVCWHDTVMWKNLVVLYLCVDLAECNISVWLCWEIFKAGLTKSFGLTIALTCFWINHLIWLKLMVNAHRSFPIEIETLHPGLHLPSTFHCYLITGLHGEFA